MAIERAVAWRLPFLEGGDGVESLSAFFLVDGAFSKDIWYGMLNLKHLKYVRRS